jgi:hypothetical protein
VERYAPDGHGRQRTEGSDASGQTGGTFAGTAGPDEERQNAATVKGTVATFKKDGKDVTNVTLDLTPEGDDVAIRFALTLEDGRLKGKGQSEFEGRKMTGCST